METTLYDDSQFRSSGAQNDWSRSQQKRPMTLDLESPSFSKKPKLAILTSPDLKMLKLATPEIEQFLMANATLTTPTPTLVPFPKFTKSATEEQENYVRGFIDALNQHHQRQAAVDAISSDNNNNSSTDVSKHYSAGVVPVYLTTPSLTRFIRSPTTSNILTTLNPITTNVVRPPSVDSNSIVVRPPSVDSNSISSCGTNSMPPLEIAIKDEEGLQTVPSYFSSPPVSPISKRRRPLHHAPIDMGEQERIKLERKRERNRLAATKCRKKKLDKISQLEDTVRELRGENAKLEAFAERLRDQVCTLKQTVVDHVKKGCQIMLHQTL